MPRGEEISPGDDRAAPAALAGKYGREYRCTYNGKTIDLGPHIAFGTGSPRTCAHFYFHID